MLNATNKGLIKALERARSDSFFVASKLAEYAAAHGTDETALIKLLGCSPTGLARLALCRAPMGTDFADEVRQIAEFVPCDPDALVGLLREVDALIALRHESRVAIPMAARDRFRPEGPSGDDPS